MRNYAYLNNCEVLKGYMYFVERVRFYKEQCEDLTQGIETAIDDCISNHVLEDFFRKRRMEVIKMAQLDYTWERREQLIRAEEREEGRQEALELLTTAVKNLKQGILPETLRAQGLDENVLQKALSLL